MPQRASEGSTRGATLRCRCTRTSFPSSAEAGKGSRAIPSPARRCTLAGYDSRIQSVYLDSTFDNAVDAFVCPQRNAFQAKSGFPSLEVYFNYGHGDEGPAVWFGKTNLPRLVALKQT